MLYLCHEIHLKFPNRKTQNGRRNITGARFFHLSSILNSAYNPVFIPLRQNWSEDMYSAAARSGHLFSLSVFKSCYISVIDTLSFFIH